MTFLLVSDNVAFRKLFSRNLLFIWENCEITEVTENTNPTQASSFSVIFIHARSSQDNNIEWFERYILDFQNTPIVVITENKDSDYAKALLRTGAKAILAKTELTKKKILNAVNKVLVTPESTIEFEGDVYIGSEQKPALPGYQVHDKISDNPVAWAVSRRQINSSSEAFIFQQFAKPELAGAVKQQFSILKKFEHPNFLYILDADLLPGNIGQLFLVQKKHEIGLRKISSIRLSAKALIQYMLNVLDGLNKLHSAGFICGFLHPDYCFLDKDNTLVLSLSPMLAFKGKRNSPYASPERRRGEKLDKRSDYYSLAAIFHYFITGTEPDVGTKVNYNNEYKLIEKVIEGALIGAKEKRYASAKEFERFISIKCAELLK